jgi:hypothetical protein
VTLPPDAAHTVYEATVQMSACSGSTTPSSCNADQSQLVGLEVLHYQASAAPSRQVRVVSWKYFG